ncbi:hypothetical protein BDN70DRAFT_900849 [Pholiota conissans]|uniref:Uncharacterized protein n=1 Tax=Pholiota conissans TaxID=109636 RepID=A0A9P5YQX1_9AGAR|nr:hypothetical protein BDN70DRAFT_900849 [Pholiota conissans]
MDTGTVPVSDTSLPVTAPVSETALPAALSNSDNIAPIDEQNVERDSIPPKPSQSIAARRNYLEEINHDPTPSELQPSKRQSFYNGEERNIINRYKDAYYAASNAETRRDIVSAQIAVELFEHWRKEGVHIRDRKKRSDELILWIRNNWRLKKPREPPTINVNPINVLWWTQWDRVFAEIARLKNVSEANAYTPGWFGSRMTAMGNILAKMPPAEKMDFDRSVADMSTRGYSEDIKRRLAKKHLPERFAKAAGENFLEMGALSITIVAYTTPDGQFCIETQDSVAEILGITASPIDEQYREETDCFQKVVSLYIKNLMQMSGREIVPEKPSIQVTPSYLSTLISYDEMNFPKISPTFVPSKTPKTVMEPLYRLFLQHHYWLASGRQLQKPVYADFTRNQAAYVDAEYLPANPTDFKLKEPRKLAVQYHVKFFEHILARQQDEKLGPSKAFRFKSFKKSGKLRPSKYPDEVPTSGMDSSNGPIFVPRQRQKKYLPENQASMQTTFAADPSAEINEQIPDIDTSPSYPPTSATVQAHLPGISMSADRSECPGNVIQTLTPEDTPEAIALPKRGRPKKTNAPTNIDATADKPVPAKGGRPKKDNMPTDIAPTTSTNQAEPARPLSVPPGDVADSQPRRSTRINQT